MVIEPKRKHQHVAVINTLEPFTEETEDLSVSFEEDAATAFLRLHQLSKALTFSVRAKTTHATEIAARMAPKPSIEHIPPEFHRYASVFSDTASRALPPHRDCDHAIDIKPGTTMKRNASIYSLTPREMEALHNWIKDNLAKGYIRPSKFPWACSFFFVQKKDGKLRPVQDYVPLNDITIVNTAPLPLINDLLDKLRGARYFTKFDLHSGYNNIRIKAGDEWKAAFKTSFGLFEPLVMTFGLCNAPATFQTSMNSLFEDLIDQGHIVVYLDDILLFHDSQTKLTTLTHEVLRRLQNNSLFLKPEKCSFAKSSIGYLGFIISKGFVGMDPAKVEAVQQYPVPSKVKEVQAFLGFCNFYHRFVKDYSTIARPLFNLTMKDTPFVWGPDQQTAFATLLQAFISAPVLALPNHSKPFRLITDTSDFATGAILEQPDALNCWHPVAYHSKALQPAERNYEIHDKELLAIIRALEIFRHYLEGHPDVLEIWTDHSNLVYFTKKQKLSC